MKYLSCLFFAASIFWSTLSFSQTDTIKAIEFFAQVIDGDTKEEPFLIKKEVYNTAFKPTWTEIYTQSGFLLAQKKVYDQQGLLEERLTYRQYKGEQVYSGKTRYYYDDAQNLTRTVSMNRCYDVLSRMDFFYNRRNEKVRNRIHFYHGGKTLLMKLEDFWVLSVVASKSKFKYKYFSDRTEITEVTRKPKQKFLWVKNKKGQLLDLFYIKNKQRHRMFKATYNAQGQKLTATFYAVGDNPAVIGITGSMKLQAGDNLKIETIYLDNGLIGSYRQYLNGELIGIQTLKYIY